MTTSIVVTSRNDGYGGHLERRAELALNTMIEHYDEVIYVDWCSPVRSLAYSLNLHETGKLRHIVVQPKDLVALGRVDLLDLPIVEVLGRNIGIHRASGDWIVSSNIDIMPAPLFDLIPYDYMYTVARRNVPVEVFMRDDFDYNMAVLLKEHLRQLGPVDDGYSLVSCCGDYQVAHRDLWYRMKGFEESLIYRDCGDSNIMKKALIYQGNIGILDLDVFHLDHSGHGETAGVTRKNSWEDAITNFTETTNPDNWGFANFAFEEEVI